MGKKLSRSDKGAILIRGQARDMKQGPLPAATVKRLRTATAQWPHTGGLVPLGRGSRIGPRRGR